VEAIDQFWLDKEKNISQSSDIHYQPIHMPKNTPIGFFSAIFAGIAGFAIIWHMWIPGVVGFVGALGVLVYRTFTTDIDYYIPAETVKKTELAHWEEKERAHAHR
jgi:cytochrome o ubiquinol oxidase subunit 1